MSPGADSHGGLCLTPRVARGGKMNQAHIAYKADAFEARQLSLFFLASLGFPLLLGGFTYAGLVHPPSGSDDPALIPWALLNLPVFLGPTTVGFVIAGLTEGQPGIKRLWCRFWHRGLSLKWIFVALLLLPGLRFVAAMLTQAMNPETYPFLVEGGVLNVLVFPVLAGAFSAIHEEFGWRGYALPRLQARWSALTSSIILGALTALWHLPAFITPGEPLFGRDFWAWVPWHLLIQVVGFTWIFNNTNGSVLAAALFHMTTSLSLFVVDTTYYWVLLAAALIILVIFGPQELVRPGRGARS